MQGTSRDRAHIKAVMQAKLCTVCRSHYCSLFQLPQIKKAKLLNWKLQSLFPRSPLTHPKQKSAASLLEFLSDLESDLITPIFISLGTSNHASWCLMVSISTELNILDMSSSSAIIIFASSPILSSYEYYYYFIVIIITIIICVLKTVVA